MRKLLTTGLLAATAAIAAPAYGQTISFTPGDYSVPAYANTGVFQNFGTGAPSGGVAFPSPNPTGGPAPALSQSATGMVRLFPGSITGVAIDPTPSGGNFLAVGSADPSMSGSYTITFNAPQQYFSFAFGTLDTYNSLDLITTAGTITLNGAAIVGQAVAFDSNGNSTVTGRVNYNFGGGAGLLGATFRSTSAAFEIDDLAAAVPEPASWAMMIAGFGIVGGALRSTRRRKTTAVAA